MYFSPKTSKGTYQESFIEIGDKKMLVFLHSYRKTVKSPLCDVTKYGLVFPGIVIFEQLGNNIYHVRENIFMLFGPFPGIFIYFM